MLTDTGVRWCLRVWLAFNLHTVKGFKDYLYLVVQPPIPSLVSIRIIPTPSDHKRDDQIGPIMHLIYVVTATSSKFIWQVCNPVPVRQGRCHFAGELQAITTKHSLVSGFAKPSLDQWEIITHFFFIRNLFSSPLHHRRPEGSLLWLACVLSAHFLWVSVSI